MSWQPGEVVAWREEWRGQEYIAVPVRVVEDAGEVLAVYVAQGTSLSFPEPWPFGAEHPWAEVGAWRGEHGSLMLMRTHDAYAIGHLWRGEDRAFKGWYVNMQEPFRRDGLSYVTQDQELDIWIEPDGTWHWKDEQELEDWVGRGRFTRAEVTEIRRVGERVVADWPFPTGWEEWRPDPAWPVPTLPVDEVTDA
ncbi:MAG TPA: DUF402 domain-containing protein [Gaiellaceae bacterium]|nr:DUF402 domain-containing protein [Gaiellaceae bacterium]